MADYYAQFSYMIKTKDETEREWLKRMAQALDRLEFDKKPKVTFQVARGVDFTIHRREIMDEAYDLLAKANRLEYGAEEEAA